MGASRRVQRHHEQKINPEPLFYLQHQQTYGLGREAAGTVGQEVFEVGAWGKVLQFDSVARSIERDA